MFDLQNNLIALFTIVSIHSVLIRGTVRAAHLMGNPLLPQVDIGYDEVAGIVAEIVAGDQLAVPDPQFRRHCSAIVFRIWS